MTAGTIGLPRCLVVAAPRRRGVGLAEVRTWRPSEGLVLFLLCAGTYLTVAVAMVHERILFADAIARVANGFYVLFSRDPHLPAVGFVWNPLPSLMLLPVLLLHNSFPVLARDGFAGNLESVIFMAGAVVLLAGCLRKLGLRRAPRLVLVALFALHPMILIYGANGQSEAVLLFFLLLSVNSLLGWLIGGQPGHLVGTGLGLGLAYLSRYEAVAPALAVSTLVGMVTLSRSTGRWPVRLRFALNDVALVSLPFAFAFGLWAVSSRILVQQWFPTFSSEYGNAAQVGTARRYIAEATGTTHAAAMEYAAGQLAGLEPLVLPLLLVAAALAIHRRDWLTLAAPAVLGAVLAFDNLAFLAGSSFGWLRFQITVIPLVVLLSGTLIRLLSLGQEGRHVRRGRRWTPILAVPVVLLAVAAALPLSVRTMADHRLAREETATMLAAVSPGLANEEDRRHLAIFQTEQQIAATLDAMHLPDSSVLTDSAFAFPILLATRHPRQFVITSDRDFKPILRDPAAAHLRYLLVPQPEKAPSDALEHAHPGLYETGAGVGRTVMSWHGASDSGDWRLLRVTDPG